MDGFSDGILCDTFYSLCWNGDDGSGGIIRADDRSPGPAQDMEVDSTTNCGSGVVTETCPFTEGTGLNAFFDGDAIVTLANNASGLNYLYDSTTGHVIEQSSGGGQLWVQDGSFENGHSGTLINVFASDNYDAIHGSEQECFAESIGIAGEPLLVACKTEFKFPDHSEPYDWTDTGT